MNAISRLAYLVIICISTTLLLSPIVLASEDCRSQEESKIGSVTSSLKGSYASTLVAANNAYANRYFSLEGLHNFQVSPEGRIFILYDLEKHLEDKRYENKIVASNVGYVHSFCLGSNLKLNVSGFYDIPLNKEQRYYNGYNGQVAQRSTLAWGEETGLKLSARYTLRRLLYDYTDNRGGQFLKRLGLEPMVSVFYTWDKLTASASFIQIMGWDFKGEQQRSQYYHTEGLAYALNDFWTLGLEHQSDGLLANATGTGFDVSLHDEDRSVALLSITFKK